MKTVLRKTISILLAACLLSVCAFADGTDTTAGDEIVVEIQLNGELMEYNSGVRPFFDTETNRTFVPFRDLFEAMGATVEFDEDTRTITATRGDTVVTFNQFGVELNIVTNGVTSTIVSDVAPLTIEGRTMVPVRFASQALGANVGWDQANKTVVVIDAPAIAASMSSDFTYMNQLNALGQLEAGKTYKTETVVIGDIAMEGMELAFVMDMLMLMNDRYLDSKVDAEFEASEELGGNFEFSMDMLADMSTYTFSLHSAMLNEALGVGENTWFEMNLMELMDMFATEVSGLGGLDFDSLSSVTSIEDTIALAINSATLTSVDDYEALMAGIEQMKEIYGDSAFITDGDYYTASYEEDGMDLTISVELEDEAVVGYSMLVTIDDATLGKITAQVAATADTVAMTMTIDMDGIAMTMEMEATIAATVDAVRTAPPAGAEVINILELLAALQLV